MNIKQFLDQPEIKELIAKGDLAAVYSNYSKHSQSPDRNDLTEYLFKLGINPIDYFKNSIPDSAFARCSRLTSITIPDGATAIGSYAFFYCSRLMRIIIPDSVTTIGSNAFAYCENLTSVVIPDSVTNIDSAAFTGCKELKSVNYNGTKEQWKSVKKIALWHYNSSIKIIHCIDGDIKLK